MMDKEAISGSQERQGVEDVPAASSEEILTVNLICHGVLRRRIASRPHIFVQVTVSVFTSSRYRIQIPPSRRLSAMSSTAVALGLPEWSWSASLQCSKRRAAIQRAIPIVALDLTELTPDMETQLIRFEYFYGQTLRRDLAEAVQASNSENVNAAPPSHIIQASHSQNITENECPWSCAQDVIGAPSQAQNGGSNIDISLAPQQSFGLYYNRSHRAYPDDTRPIYGNNQWPWPSQQQPTYQPNYSPCPSLFSPGSANLHPAYPVFNAAAFGPMTHPPPFVLPTAFSTQLPSVLPPVAGHSLGSSGHRMPRGHPPYEPSWQIVYPYY